MTIVKLFRALTQPAITTEAYLIGVFDFERLDFDMEGCQALADRDGNTYFFEVENTETRAIVRHWIFSKLNQPQARKVAA